MPVKNEHWNGFSASGVASFDVSAIPTGGGDPDYNTNVI
jgi:hypothetical protein